MFPSFPQCQAEQDKIDHQTREPKVSFPMFAICRVTVCADVYSIKRIVGGYDWSQREVDWSRSSIIVARTY